MATNQVINYSALGLYTDQLTQKQIIREAVLQGTTFKYISILENVSQTTAINYQTSTLILQTGQCISAANGTGSVVLAQANLTVCPISVIENICPDQEKQYWLGKLMKMGSYVEDLEPKEFAEVYTADKLAKIQAAVEDLYWQGDTTGTYSASFTQCNGLLHVLDSTSATVSIINATWSGAITSANALNVFDDMWAQVNSSIPNILTEPDITAFVSYPTFTALTVALRKANYFIDYINSETIGDPNKWELKYPSSNFIVVATRGLNATTTMNKIIMSPASNIFAGFDNFKDSSDFRIWYEQYYDTVNLRAKWKQGAAVVYPQYICYKAS